MSAFDNILAELAALRAKVEEQHTTLTLGTYQSDGTVLLTDGAKVTPAATLAIVGTGDKVLLAQHNRRAYIVGQASPTATSYSLGSLSDVDTTGASTGDHLVFDGTQWEPYEPPDPVMRAQAGRVTLSFTSGQTVKETSNITFSPAFSATPRILLTLAEENGDIILSTTDKTASVFKVRGTRLSDTFAQNVAVDWLAIPDGSLSI